MGCVRFCMAVVAVGILWLGFMPVGTAQEEAQLPGNWRGLSMSEFCDAAEPAVAAGSIDKDLHEEVKAHAASLLLEHAGTEEDYSVLFRLQRIGRHIFHRSDVKADQLKDILRNRIDDWTGRSYGEARTKMGLMGAMAMPAEDYLAVGRRWHEDGGQLADVWDEDLPLAHYVFTSADYVKGNFSVRWEGSLTVPADGDYTFSISPIDTNAQYRDYFVNMSMDVTVDGKQLISASPDNWDATGESVALRGDSPVPLQVDLAVEASGYTEGGLHAMLYWSGPGITKELIPSSALTPADSDGNGLQATYTWKDDLLFQRLVRTDPAIDFAWATGDLALTEDSSVRTEATQLMWQRSMAADALDNLEESEELHPFFREPYFTASGLSSAQRQAFLQELVVRPALLRNVEPKTFWKFYTAFRLGAAEEALDAVGVWAIQNSDHHPVINGSSSRTAIDIYFRDACRRIGHLIVHETDQADTLRDQHLELADGTCCLPVAWILGYSYLTKGQIKEWTAFLDAKLMEPAITGEKRVNWLLARAHAAEIRQGSTRPYFAPIERLMAGRSMIDEAAEAAVTPESRCRCALELAARLLAIRRFDECRDCLETASAELPAEQQQDIAGVSEVLDELVEADQIAKTTPNTAAAKAYLQKLQQRREKAVASGNSDAVARYDRLIEAAAARASEDVQ